MDNFPVFDEFLPNFFYCLSILTFFTRFHAKNEKNFGALRHLQHLSKQFCLTNWKNFRGFAPFARCHEDFICCWREKQRRNEYIFVTRGGQNLSFWPKYLPLIKFEHLTVCTILERPHQDFSGKSASKGQYIRSSYLFYLGCIYVCSRQIWPLNKIILHHCHKVCLTPLHDKFLFLSVQ